MKRIFCLILLGVAIWLVTVPVQATSLSSVFIKNFVIDRWSGRIATFKVELRTPLYDVGTEREIIVFKRLFNIHQQATKAFRRLGWKEQLTREVAAEIFVGTVVVMVEERIGKKFKPQLVIKTHILPCNPDPLWGIIKFRRGELDNYFFKIVKRMEECIKENYKIP